MEILGWLWWMVSTLIGAVWTVVWFLVSGWVSTLLQIMLLVVTICFSNTDGNERRERYGAGAERSADFSGTGFGRARDRAPHLKPMRWYAW